MHLIWDRLLPSLTFWRLVYGVFLGLALMYKTELDASLRDVYRTHLLHSAFFQHDSAEPVLVVVTFYAAMAWFNGLEVAFSRGIQRYKVQPDSVPSIRPSLRRVTSPLGVLKAVVYLGPIVAYDVMFPRKVLSLECPGVFEVVFSVLCCLFWYDALFTLLHLVLHSCGEGSLLNRVHGKHHRNPRVQAFDTLELSLVEAVSEVGCSIAALKICQVGAVCVGVVF
jgi:sterol desaturase/sphingolipid hydroxylase (fatty acid hydroxylase superfamily)